MARRTECLAILSVGLILISAVASTGYASGNPHETPVVYVEGQQLYYDSILGPDLPMHGEFQQLTTNRITGLTTRFGPGDKQYLGGRWWVDLNRNEEMDVEDHYFLCPLLPPGRERP